MMGRVREMTEESFKGLWNCYKRPRKIPNIFLESNIKFFVKMTHICKMSYSSISNLNIGTVMICDPYTVECDPDMAFMA